MADNWWENDPVAGQGAAPAAPAGSDRQDFYSADPTAAPEQQGWGDSIRSGLMSLIPGMSSGGWGPQNWRPPAYGASDAAVHGATLGASDIVRGAIGDLYGGPSMTAVKAQRDKYAAAHPVANLAANLAGGVATAPLLPGGGLFKAASDIANPAARWAATIGTGGLLGAGFGAAGGAIDEAPTGNLGQIGAGAEQGAKWGALLGAAIPPAVSGLGAGYRALANREWLPAIGQGERDIRGGYKLQRDLTDSQSVIEQGAQPPNPANQTVPGPPEAAPTTAQLTGDVGAIGMQSDLIAGIAARPENTWSPAERELVQKAQAQGEARTASLQGESPVGADPNNVKLAVQQHLDDVNQHNDTVLGSSLPPEQRGEQMRAQSEAAKATAKQGAQALYDAVDPDGTLRIDQRGVGADARQIVRDTPQSAKPPEGEEAAVFQRALMGGSAVPFTEFQALRGRLLDAIRAERATNGDTPSLRRMTQLRQSMDNTLSDVAASGADAGTVGRLRDANAAWRQMKETYNNQFVGPLLQTGGAVGDYKVPDVNVGQRIIANNQSAQAFLAAGGDHATLRGALVDDLNRSLKGGDLTPQKLQAWRSTRDGAIRAVPGLDADLDNLTTGARAGVVGRVADAGSGADVRANVASILTGSPLGQTSRNSASEMMRLKAVVAGNPEAEAGLKAAVIDHISDRFVDPKTGDIKPGFLRFMQEKRGALDAAVGPDGMRVLDALVADLQRPQVARPDALAGGRAAGAPTGLRAIMQQLGQNKLGVGGAAAIGSLTHLATQDWRLTAAAIGAAAAKVLRTHGIANQAELLAQAMNNPALARALLIKATEANAAMITKGIAAAMAGTRSGAPLSYSFTGPQPPQRRAAGRPFDGGGGGDTGDGGEYTAAGTPPNAPTLTLGGEPVAGPPTARGEAGPPQYRDAITDYIAPWARKVASGGFVREGLPSSYDPNRSFAANALDPRGVENALNVALGVGGGSGLGIKAYHGSPYDFERFDASKIGTGEGAQAYGHGLYFAEHEPVAQGYRDAVKDTSAIDALNKRMSDVVAQMEKLGQMPSNRQWADARWPEHDRLSAQYDKLMSERETLVSQPGKMYEVNINAEPEQFLNWDKPFNEQSPTLKSVLNTLANNNPALRDIAGTTGEGYYQSIGRKLGNEELLKTGPRLPTLPSPGPPLASAALSQAGIPGIRYLDQGSRLAFDDATRAIGDVQRRLKYADEIGATDAAKQKLRDELAGYQQRLQGTSNYVVFDPKIIEIFGKYGLAGLIAGGGALGLTGGAAQAQSRLPGETGR